MVGFVVRRVVTGILVLAGLSLASFCFFAPRDTLLKLHPVLPEYWTWLKGVFTGSSLHLLTQPAPVRLNLVTTTMLAAIGHTAALLAAAFVLVIIFSVALAVLAAARRGSALDLLLRAFTYLAWGIPAFLLALLVQKLVFSFGGSLGVGPLPLAGWPGSCPPGLGLNAGTLVGCPSAGSGPHYVVNVLRYITLPAVTLAVGFVGLHARYLRSALLETLDAPFVTTARAKGLSERNVIVRHALRASIVTFVGALLADFGAVFGAAMAVDWIFQLNGLGTVLVAEFPVSFGSIDAYSMQLVLLITAALVLVSSFLGELTVAWLDPRVRAE